MTKAYVYILQEVYPLFGMLYLFSEDYRQGKSSVYKDDLIVYDMI